MNPYLTKLNQYKTMWVLVFFDLPTELKSERRAATGFRNHLLKDGFSMFQFSIYTRFCPSRENAAVHIRRVKNALPPKGKVCIMQITDKQFGMMEIFHCAKEAPATPPSQQLELF